MPEPKAKPKRTISKPRVDAYLQELRDKLGFLPDVNTQYDTDPGGRYDPDQQRARFAPFLPLIYQSAQENDYDPAALLAQILQESAFSNSWPLGHDKEVGIGQLTPPHWANANPGNPEEVIPYMAKLMSGYARQYGNLPDAFAAYNAGPGSVQTGYPDVTKRYIRSISDTVQPDSWLNQLLASLEDQDMNTPNNYQEHGALGQQSQAMRPMPFNSPSPQDYEVQSGDTLSAIAQLLGMALPQLLQANTDITNPNLIRPGQRIRRR